MGSGKVLNQKTFDGGTHPDGLTLTDDIITRTTEQALKKSGMGRYPVPSATGCDTF
jgi:hypothetical protein